MTTARTQNAVVRVYLLCKNRIRDIGHLSHLFKLNRVCANAMHRLDRAFDRGSVNKSYICGNRMGDTILNVLYITHYIGAELVSGRVC